MKIRGYAVLAGASLALLLAAPAMTKPAQHHGKVPAAHHIKRHSARPRYDYRTADSVREEFADTPRGYWMRESRGRYDSRMDYRQTRDGQVVENLRGDFNGGVGYGTDGFVDGYGQTHFFVGSFRQMNRGGPFMPHRFAPSRGHGF